MSNPHTVTPIASQDSRFRASWGINAAKRLPTKGASTRVVRSIEVVD
jgi:hypothetical protein